MTTTFKMKKESTQDNIECTSINLENQTELGTWDMMEYCVNRFLKLDWSGGNWSVSFGIWGAKSWMHQNAWDLLLLALYHSIADDENVKWFMNVNASIFHDQGKQSYRNCIQILYEL